jgi:tetratricopeptide (TPR) repeat protein
MWNMKPLRLTPVAWRKDWLFCLLLLAVTIIAYQPVWHAGFIWDDDVLLLNNPLIKLANGWWRVWFARSNDYVPATSTTFWLEWRLFGANAPGYHLDNVLLHALDAVLLWRVLRRLLIPGAWLAAAIFVLHPVNVESVAWIAERKNTLAMLFYACTLLWYLRFEDTGHRRWYWLSAGAFVVGIFSKTAVAPIPFVLLGIAWWRRGRIGRKDLCRSLLFFAIAVAASLLAISIQLEAGAAEVRTDNFLVRLVGAGWSVLFYLYKTLLPLNLIFVYPRWRIDIANVLSYIPLTLLVGGLALCWRCRRTWGKGLLFALGYFIVALLPVLGFVNIYFMRYSLVADHWQYFAIIGPICLAAALIRKVVLATMLLLTLGVLTWQQCGIYAGQETLWRETIARNPDCWMAHDNLGVCLLARGDTAEAIASYHKALEIKPDYERALYNLGLALFCRGDLDGAIAQYRHALDIKLDFVVARSNLGVALEQKGELEAAIVQYRKALEIQPGSSEVLVNLGNALSKKGQFDEALEMYRQALEVNPANEDAHLNRGIALFRNGNMDGAIAEYRAALALK